MDSEEIAPSRRSAVRELLHTPDFLRLWLVGAFANAISEAVNRKLIVMLALLVPAVVSTVLATLATTGHLELWHLALGNLVSGTMWATAMSTRRRMVGEVAGAHRIVPAIALDSATNAATHDRAA